MYTRSQANAYGLLHMCDLPPPISLLATIFFFNVSCSKEVTEFCASEEQLSQVCKAASKPDHDPEIGFKINRYAHMQLQHSGKLDSFQFIREVPRESATQLT